MISVNEGMSSSPGVASSANWLDGAAWLALTTSFSRRHIRLVGESAKARASARSMRPERTSCVDGGRMPAVEVMLNTKLIADLIERGNFSGVKEAMEKSMAEGSQTFEEALAQLIRSGRIDRAEGLGTLQARPFSSA